MTFRKPALWLAVFVQALALHLPAGAQQAADYIVAVVNAEPITNNELHARMARFEEQLRQQGMEVPPRAQFAQQVLERLISEKAQLQLAAETGVKIQDSLVDQAEANLARQNQMSLPELRQRLQGEGMNEEQLRKQLRDQLTLQRLREREFENRARVSDLEVDQYLNEQARKSNDPASLELNLAQVLVAVPENASATQVQQLRAKAEDVQKRAKAGEDFVQLARQFSDAPGAAQNGGALGLRSADRLPPAFVQAVQGLPDGGVSNIVRSDAGFHVLKVLERHRKGMPPGTVVQTHARHILLRPNAQMSEAQAVQRLADFKRRIVAGQADFAQLAREYSQDGSAKDGGDLGWATPGLFVPEFEEAMNSLAPGQIADPVISRFGVHLVQVLERREAKLTDQQQRELTRNMLREKKIDEAYATWAQEVRGRAFVELREPPR
jgi:peptidyl-prolyl cis-trans isomerase SurA